jgi:hypothetical protein
MTAPQKCVERRGAGDLAFAPIRSLKIADIIGNRG